MFVNEWLTTSRRWQVYAGRSVFVAALLVGLWSAWVSRASNQGVPTIQIMASVGQGFFSAIAFTQMTFTLMVAPASTAGAICQDRSSGKLEQLLTTELSDSEIILGKLAARLLPMLGLVTCALPALALSTLLGGVDPLALAGAFLITVGLAVLGCTLALTFSLWAGKPYEALLATYCAYGIWLIVLPTWDFLGRLWFIPTSPDWAIPFSPLYLGVCALHPARKSWRPQLCGVFRRDAGDFGGARGDCDQADAGASSQVARGVLLERMPRMSARPAKGDGRTAAAG